MLKWYLHVLGHKWLVLLYILKFCIKLIRRGIIHDLSKFTNAEAKLFVKVRPKLKASTYGNQDYQDLLEQLKPALEHHYKNRHHPEAHEMGINGMNFIDLLEMWFDWNAATKKHVTGDIWRSISVNKERFYIGEQLEDIMRNSVGSIR